MQKEKIWRTIILEKELWEAALEKSKQEEISISAFIRIFLKKWIEGKVEFDAREKQ